MSARTDDTVVMLRPDAAEDDPISNACNGVVCLALLVPVIGLLWLMLSWLYSVLHGLGHL